MASTNKCLLLSLFLIVVRGMLPVFAQDRCGTVEALQSLRNKKLIRESDDQFEEWVNRRRASSRGRTNASGVYTIPVVVHIVHKGEAIGSGVNISDAQVLSQIKVLNKDFNRLNSDASSTPTEFQSVAGSMNIQFVLAKQDPNGILTSGINRVKGTQNQWAYSNDAALKVQSYWPAEDYLNIWVTDLSSTLLGYAQFPVSDLDGLEDAVTSRLTDGVAIDYSVFGSLDDGAFSLTANFTKGRTTTHEVGHFLGLRHIWGDDSGACTGSDYVADTPSQGNNTSGCPSNPQTSCSVHTMFQNYMDYTNDVCMNLFTQGQVARMVTVIENSPRRVSLLESDGAEDPAPVSNDLAVQSLVSPTANICAGSLVASAQVKNLGTNVITAATLKLSVNSQAVETRTFTFGSSLQPNAVQLIYFSPVTLASGSHTVKVEIIQTNGAADGKTSDNAGSVVTIVPEAITAPFAESFETLPAKWTIKNSDGITAWEVKNATKGIAANTALYMRFFGTTAAVGAQDILFSPVFDLSGAPLPYLSFDVAHARNGNSADELKVYVITNCSNTPSAGTEVYSKTGSALATATASSSSFSPSGEGDWRKEVIDLSAFIGQPNVQLAFVGINNGGNNLYVDNIAVTRSMSANIAITAIARPSPVHCSAEAQPTIVVNNPGVQTITSLKIRGSVNGAEQINFTQGDFNLTPGASKEVTLPQIALTAGENIFTVSLTEVNGFVDIDQTDNVRTLHTVVNTAANYIPLRQTFNDGTYQDEWTIVSPAGGQQWEEASTNYDQSIYFNAQSSTLENDETWLVSPSLDLSTAVTASMFFDLSYVNKSASSNKEIADDFKILYSKDCGNSYGVLKENMLPALSLPSTLSGNPSSDAQWQRQYINLNSLSGEGEVRIALVFKNTADNNIYLDNIEFFLSDNPSPQAINESFAVYGTDPTGPQDFYVTFNLADRQDVSYALVDINGRQVISNTLSDVLNQTYQIEPNTRGGLYIFRLRIGKEVYSTRIFLDN